MNILMVCLGNICRSPLAQGILEAQIRKNNLPWTVDSCGTSSFHAGEPADSRSIEVAAAHGIDISDQRSRMIKVSDLDNFDLILVMDASNYNDVKAMTDDSSTHDKIKMILNYSYPNQNRKVPDPYYEGGFDGVYKLLDEACVRLIAELK